MAERKQIGIKLDLGLLNKVDEVVGKEGISRTEFVEKALAARLEAQGESAPLRPATKPAAKELPTDPQGRPIVDKEIRDAAEKHGEAFWKLADEIEADGEHSRVVSRHLAAQRLIGTREASAKPHNEVIAEARERNREVGGPRIGDVIADRNPNVNRSEVTPEQRARLEEFIKRHGGGK